ncbi:hypothetical protein CEXT_723511 [Caerostris extrusa]|uniref:Uncharacterized protein n=1 Tax=Caerostris extrusa TaxID=172846 RepID=A0AAV4QHL1_CAEEX|nr:hypothetical protein CEXT_723511 [Caerostris extrusa]
MADFDIFSTSADSHIVQSGLFSNSVLIRSSSLLWAYVWYVWPMLMGLRLVRFWPTLLLVQTLSGGMSNQKDRELHSNYEPETWEKVIRSTREEGTQNRDFQKYHIYCSYTGFPDESYQISNVCTETMSPINLLLVVS